MQFHLISRPQALSCISSELQQMFHIYLKKMHFARDSMFTFCPSGAILIQSVTLHHSNYWDRYL